MSCFPSDRTLAAMDLQVPRTSSAILNALHQHMANLRELLKAKDAWAVPMIDSNVSLAMLDNACEPDGRVLEWIVYQTLLDIASAAEVCPPGLKRRAHLAYRGMLVSDNDPDPTPPKRRAEMNHLQRQLLSITTEATLITYLRRLQTQKALSLRQIEQQLELHHPKNTTSSSCLGNWLNSDRLPRSRPRFEALVQVLLPDYPDAPTREALRLIMGRYDDLLAGNAIADTQAPAETETAAHWRAKYEQAEQAIQDLARRLHKAELIIAQELRPELPQRPTAEVDRGVIRPRVNTA